MGNVLLSMSLSAHILLFPISKITVFFWLSTENSEITGEDGQDLDLTPPLLEEAVNLLLVNKTVMSCILVLQNREDSQMTHESTRTELPTVIRAPLRVCCTIRLVCWGHYTGNRILFSPQTAIVSAITENFGAE